MSLLAIALIGSSLLLAGWCGLTAAMDRAVQLPHLALAGLVEALLVVQLVAGIARLVSGAGEGSPVLVTGYLVAALLLLPVGVFLALLERSRWGAVVLGVAALVVPVVQLRLQQVWEGTGA